MHMPCASIPFQHYVSHIIGCLQQLVKNKKNTYLIYIVCVMLSAFIHRVILVLQPQARITCGSVLFIIDNVLYTRNYICMHFTLYLSWICTGYTCTAIAKNKNIVYVHSYLSFIMQPWVNACNKHTFYSVLNADNTPYPVGVILSHRVVGYADTQDW